MPPSARPLVTYEPDGRTLRVDEETCAWLAATATRPFAVLACAGKFRTGKSFLLNRFLRRPPGKGFSTGDTVQACTRGIWVATDFLPSEEREGGGVDVLVLDTEGIGALDADSESDVRIFALAVLLCTSFAYNCATHLDESAVQTLSLMTRVAEAVGGEDTAHSPTLYWILRDFALQLTDPSGAPLSHAAYLEAALASPATSPSSSSSSKCATREAIRHVFPRRHLVTLPRPHKGDTAQKLEQKGSGALVPKFEKCLSTFRAHVLAHAKPFSVAGVPAAGATYVAHARNLVRLVNENDAIPKLEDSWTLLARVQHAEEEGRVKTDLLSRSERGCPTGPEEEVRSWLEGEASEIEVRLAPPVPDGKEGEVRSRAVGEALRLARERGCVKDLDALASEAADEACDAFAKTGYSEDGFPHLTDAPPSLLSDKTARAVLARLARVHYPASREAVREEERRAADGAQSLEVQRLRVELEVLRRENEERKEREEREEREREEREKQEEREERETRANEAIAREEEALPPVQVGEDEEEDDPASAAHARTVLDLEECLAAADARVREAEERGRAREASALAAYEESMEALRADTVSSLAAARRERDAARAEAKTRSDQKDALASECDRLRALAREAQESAVDVHRATLETLSKRDAEARASAEHLLREKADERARAEACSAEARALKRRVEELFPVAEEAKRLRVDRAREEAERDLLRAQVSSAREENETLRASNADLQSRLAVLHATAKLESCRRALT